MSVNDSSIEVLLSSLRDNFLAGMYERCDLIEGHILNLEHEETFADSFNELFRAIHSLKGSGGTMKLPVFTSISHQFEDLISLIDGKRERIQAGSIDAMLKYNDLLRLTSQEIISSNFDIDVTHIELQKLKNAGRKLGCSCMFVDQSNTLSRFVAKEFKNASINIVSINNGLVALERLVHEKFDFLVTSKELPDLNGLAIISAIRYSESKNSKIPCVITTSKENVEPIKHIDSVVVIRKDKMLAKNLVEYIVANIAVA